MSSGSRRPGDALAYSGELQATLRTGATGQSLAPFQHVLERAPAGARVRAVLHHALGVALMEWRYPRYLSEDRDLGPEPEQHLKTALRLNPALLVARLALAGYYAWPRSPNGHRGTLAREQYDTALGQRPDLAREIRYLHART